VSSIFIFSALIQTPVYTASRSSSLLPLPLDANASHVVPVYALAAGGGHCICPRGDGQAELTLLSKLVVVAYYVLLIILSLL